MNSIKPGISVQYTENATVVTFMGEKILEEKEIKSLQESIMLVIEQSGHINLILDFGNVKFLSSAVLGLLLRVSKRIYERDSRLRLCNIDSKIYEIFKVTRLNKIFEIYPDLAGAMEDLPAVD